VSTATPVAVFEDPEREPVDPPEVVRETAGVDRVLKLLIVYRNKLNRVIAEYREVAPTTGGKGNPVMDLLQGRPHARPIRNLRPAVTKLAQYASGLIENARIPQLDKIELQLRLAELESALEIATETIR